VTTIAIVGTTSFGTTLGLMLSDKGLSVKLLARTKNEATRISNSGVSRAALKDVKFPPNLSVTADPEEALKDARAVLMVVPAQTMRQNIRQIKDHLNGSMLIISAAKGIEVGTHKRMSQVIADEIDGRFHKNIAVLSGPNLYKEILGNLPAASVVAAENDVVTRKAQRLLNTPNFCVYTNTDVAGVEIGGATKNIIAMGAGIADGLGYGDNAKAALMTRGLTEITALGVALGASPLTFSGLAGLGDLIATCASPLSRNHYVGIQLGKGRKLENILKSMDSVAEGVDTTRSVWSLAKELGLEMP
jgi:glycerol-3-phosphate dehydrogenase (NAD(P)+)